MKWNFWKRPKNEPTRGVIETMPMAALFRWYCYDLSIDNVHELSLSLGLTPISKEAEESELSASNARLGQLKSLFPFLDMIAQINAGVMSEQQKSVIDNLSLNDEQVKKLLDMFKENFYGISLAALVSAFSSGLALKLITKGPVIPAGVVDL